MAPPKGSVYSQGRPKLPIEKITHKPTKRKRVEDLLDRPFYELLHAAFLAASSENRWVLRELEKNGGVYLKEMVSLGEKSLKDSPKILETSQALSLFYQNSLNRRSYTNLRMISNSAGHKFLPAHNHLAKERKRMVQELSPTVTSLSYKIDPELLIKKTTLEIFKILDHQTALQVIPNNSSFEIFYKCGSDASGKHPVFRHAYEAEDLSQASNFVVSGIVPLLLTQNDKKLWINETCNGRKLFRPTEFLRKKETDEITRSTDEKFKNLEFVLEYADKCFNIKLNLLRTMYDGKSTRAITEQNVGSTSCPVCLSKPSEMNNPYEWFKDKTRPEFLLNGCSLLHVGLHSMESCLNLSKKIRCGPGHLVYKTPDKKKEAEEYKKIVNELKELDKNLQITSALTGSSFKQNSGNISRDFFREYLQAEKCEILEIPLEFFKKIRLLLTAVKSKYLINVENYKKEAKWLHNFWLRNWKKIYFPLSLHMLIYHPPELQTLLGDKISVGQTGEDNVESAHSLVRNTRRKYVVGKDAETEMLTIGNHFVMVSSPWINYNMYKPKVYKNSDTTYNKEEANLLILPTEYDPDSDSE